MLQRTDNQIFNAFTIGHGNRKTVDFINLLKRHEIEALIDVRTFPVSRFNPQFNKARLEADLMSAGIQYVFLGNELGGRPKDPALYREGKLSYPAIKQTALFKAGIDRVVELVKSGIKVTLMCSESDQNQCHRKHLIADELIKLGISIFHIDKIGAIERHQYDWSLFN